MSETVGRPRWVASDDDEAAIRLFEGDGIGAIERALAAAGGPGEWRFRLSGVETILDTFVDTADWRLLRGGVALRVRWGAPPSAQLERATGDDRSKESFPVELAPPPSPDRSIEWFAAAGPLGERVRVLAGNRPLVRHLELRTRRATYEGESETARARIEVDEIRIARRVGSTGLAARRMEVVVGRAGAASLEAWIREHAAGLELRPASALFETSARLAGLVAPPEPDLGTIELEPSVSIGALAFVCLRRQALAFLRHEPGTRLGEDPEPLHDMRVAARRMRAAFDLFAPFLPRRAEGLRRELGRLGRILGAVRDLDVQLEELSGWRRAAAPEDAASFDALEARLVRRRGIARRRLLGALDAARYERFVARLSAFLRRGPGRRLAAGRAAARTAAPELIRRAYGKVRKSGEALTADAPAAEFHRLRIRAKRLRYALEFHLPLYDGAVRAMIDGVTELQDLLGEHQDAVVAIEHLRGLASVRRGSLPPHALFVMGSLAERYARRAADLRGSFGATFRKIGGKRWKRLREALEAGAAGVV